MTAGRHLVPVRRNSRKRKADGWYAYHICGGLQRELAWVGTTAMCAACGRAFTSTVVAEPWVRLVGGLPCWCVSLDEPHEGWVHAPVCVARRERVAAAGPERTDEPTCPLDQPGNTCWYCTGEACAACGGRSPLDPPCDHDVIARHEQAVAP